MALTPTSPAAPAHLKVRHSWLLIVAGLLILLLPVLFLFVWPNLNGCSGSCVRVLFIGNSYTYVNDLPTVFTRLAKSGGHNVQTGLLAGGGWTFEMHLQAARTQETLTSSHWDYVVLQEQSEIPAILSAREQSMFPSARELVAEIRAVDAVPIFFQTWGHLDGDKIYGIPDYAAMQYALDEGYRQIGQELGVTVAPVGDAWWQANHQQLALELWQPDNSHPTAQGTYLAACVFYKTIFGESPVGLAYTGGLATETVRKLQALAGQLTIH